MRCPATPVFVKDARRLHPAQTTVRAHRRSASMDPIQTGVVVGGARSGMPSAGQDAGRTIGHRRNVTMDPSQGEAFLLSLILSAIAYLESYGSPPLRVSATFKEPSSQQDFERGV